MRLILILLPALMISPLSWGEPPVKGFHLICSKKELALKDCDLHRDHLKVGVSSQKIRFIDDPWTSIAEFPSADTVAEWQEVKIESVGERSLISLKVWEKIENEITLEELHWILLEPQQRRLLHHLDIVIGKRTRGKDQKPLKDPLKKTSLSVVGKDKPSKILWTAGEHSGEF